MERMFISSMMTQTCDVVAIAVLHVLPDLQGTAVGRDHVVVLLKQWVLDVVEGVACVNFQVGQEELRARVVKGVCAQKIADNKRRLTRHRAIEIDWLTVT